MDNGFMDFVLHHSFLSKLARGKLPDFEVTYRYFITSSRLFYLVLFAYTLLIIYVPLIQKLPFAVLMGLLIIPVVLYLSAVVFWLAIAKYKPPYIFLPGLTLLFFIAAGFCMFYFLIINLLQILQTAIGEPAKALMQWIPEFITAYGKPGFTVFDIFLIIVGDFLIRASIKRARQLKVRKPTVDI